MIKTQTASELSKYELMLLEIIRKLPAERVAQLIEFARFLEWQTKKTDVSNGHAENNAVANEVPTVEQDQWEPLLAKPEAKQLMRKMAREALAEYRAGQATDITTTEDGRLAPA